MRNQGIYTDITIEDYHNDKEYLSSTGLKYARNSLKTFYYWMQGHFDKDNVSHFDFGNAMELALCNEDEFNANVAIMDDTEILESIDTKSKRATKVYKEWLANFHKENEGKYIINKYGSESWETIVELLKSCRQDAVITKLIQNTQYQYSLYWTDPTTGLNLRTRPDICKVNKNIVVDIKTARNGRPDVFARDAAKLEYLFQAVMQIDGVVSTGLMPKVDDYYYLVLEKEVPYAATLYRVDKEDLKIAEFFYRKTLQKVAEAKEKNFYPAYSDFAELDPYGIIDLEMPAYWRNQNY